MIENKRSHLPVLQQRLNLHGSRMWQFPFTYVGLIFLVLGNMSSFVGIVKGWLIFANLTLIGLILFGAFYGAYEGYRRTVKKMNEIELDLQLGETSRCFPSHYVPYFLMLIFEIIFCGSLTFYSYFQI